MLFFIIYGFTRFLSKQGPAVHRYMVERLNSEVKLKVSDKWSSFQHLSHKVTKYFSVSSNLSVIYVFLTAAINSAFIFIRCKEHLSMLKDEYIKDTDPYIIIRVGAILLLQIKYKRNCL